MERGLKTTKEKLICLEFWMGDFIRIHPKIAHLELIE
jgi:hypothetical protein